MAGSGFSVNSKPNAVQQNNPNSYIPSRCTTTPRDIVLLEQYKSDSEHVVKLQNMWTVNTALALLSSARQTDPLQEVSFRPVVERVSYGSGPWLDRWETLPDFLHGAVWHHHIKTCGRTRGSTKWMMRLSPLLISVKRRDVMRLSSMSNDTLSSISVVK